MISDKFKFNASLLVFYYEKEQRRSYLNKINYTIWDL